MAFTEYTSEEIEVGKSIKKSLWDKLKNNFSDHELRIYDVEQNSGKVVVANFSVTGYISHYESPELVDILTFRAPAAFELIEFSITLTDSTNAFNSVGVPVVSSTVGLLELNIQKSINNGIDYVEILSTKPSIADGRNGKGLSSNDAGNTPAFFNDVSVKQDDLLRIDVTSLKDITGSFQVTCYGEIP